MILGKAYRQWALAAAKVLGSIIRLLPDRTILGIRSNTALAKKMDYNRCDIFLSIESEIENDIRTRSSSKEPETIHWIETFFREGDVFYDVGANVGAYSMVASKFFQGKLKVYAFEPGFVTFAQLCKNIHLNDCQDSIIPMQVALSDNTKIDYLNYNNLIPGGALHALGSPVNQSGATFNPVFRQAVLSYRIDDLIEGFSIPVPNHMKVDVDGTEFNILKGAAETLANPSLNTIIMEVEEGSVETDRMLEYLEDKGLKVHSRHRFPDPSGNFPNMYNYIFNRTPGG